MTTLRAMVSASCSYLSSGAPMVSLGWMGGGAETSMRERRLPPICPGSALVCNSGAIAVSDSAAWAKGRGLNIPVAGVGVVFDGPFF
ncbi:hypothetical protein NG795_04400 [Laspinema sp. D3]|nr:hypothetical protein [Laspinema sp. D2c]